MLDHPNNCIFKLIILMISSLLGSSTVRFKQDALFLGGWALKCNLLFLRIEYLVSLMFSFRSLYFFLSVFIPFYLSCLSRLDNMHKVCIWKCCIIKQKQIFLLSQNPEKKMLATLELTFLLSAKNMKQMIWLRKNKSLVYISRLNVALVKFFD